MSAASPVSVANDINAIGRCQICGSMRQTSLVKFHRNIGMLVARRTIAIQGQMCKTCLGKKYWEFMGKGLLLGPWGMISLIVTPIYLITNTVSYISAKNKLHGAIE